MRFIGIQHRVKKSVNGDARPTLVTINIGEKVTSLKLETETDELDFVKGQYPIKFREVAADDDLSKFAAHHVQWTKLGSDADLTNFNEDHIKTESKATYAATKVPAAYEGLQRLDSVGMVLGGSGDNLAFALASRAEQIGAKIFRVPPFRLNQDRDKSSDAELFAKLVENNLDLFYEVTARDRETILLREALRCRTDAQKARIACENRLRGRTIGEAFCRPEGYFPEGDIEKAYDRLKATDKILLALQDEEKLRNGDLEKTCKNHWVYQAIFGPIEGVGPAIGGRIIAAITDIRRFMVFPDSEEMEELYTRSQELERQANVQKDMLFIQDRLEERDTHFDKLCKLASWKRAAGKMGDATLIEQSIALHKQRSYLRWQAEVKTTSKVKAFCGVHVQMWWQCLNPECSAYVNADNVMLNHGTDAENEAPELPVCPKCGSTDVVIKGRLPMRRNGQVANWNGDSRQALYLLADQFNRRPNTPWGAKLRENKAKLRVKHPFPVVEEKDSGKIFQLLPDSYKYNSKTREYLIRTSEGQEIAVKGKMIHSDAHIHKMAVWKTLSQFVVWMTKEWIKLEQNNALRRSKSASK